METSSGNPNRSSRTTIYSAVAALAALMAVALVAGTAFGAFSLGGNASVTVTTSTGTTTITTNTTTSSSSPPTSAILEAVSIGTQNCTIAPDGLSFTCDNVTSIPISVTETVTVTTTIGGATSNSSSFSTPVYGTQTLSITVENIGSSSMTPVSVHAASNDTGIVSVSPDPVPSPISPGSTATYSWTLTAVSGGSATITGSITG